MLVWGLVLPSASDEPILSDGVGPDSLPWREALSKPPEIEVVRLRRIRPFLGESLWSEGAGRELISVG
jgi:hypothetical protein